jgi:hypothetical protein
MPMSEPSTKEKLEAILTHWGKIETERRERRKAYQREYQRNRRSKLKGEKLK